MRKKLLKIAIGVGIIVSLLLPFSNIEGKATSACNEILINEDFTIDSDSYIFFIVSLDNNSKYRINMTIDESCQIFFVNNTNLQLFQGKETFYTIGNSEVQFWFDTPFCFEYGDGLSMPYETNYTGEAVIILNNIQDVGVSGHLTFEVTKDRTIETTTQATFLIVTPLSLILVLIFAGVKRRKISK